jgi:CubicO group peptidase (beta-lactamase class C family)
MKRISLLVIVLCTCICWQASSQTIDISGKHIANVDYDRLKRIDTLVNGYIAKGWLTGVVTMVVKDNQLVQYKGYGYFDAASKKPMPNDALFRLASQSKAVICTGIMTLWEEGKFTLDEPIADFIPEFKNPKVLDKYNAADTTYTTVPAKRDITFRDLLTHTGGIDYAVIGSPNMVAIYAKAGIPVGLGKIDANLKERMAALAKLPLVSQPGEKWNYSLSIDILGALIEIISGTDLQDYLTQKIFKPLGMKDTYFNVPTSKANRLATVYTEDSLGHVVKWGKTFRNIDPDYPLLGGHYYSGGAGLTGTAYDYAIFLQMMLNKGSYNGVQILAPRTVELMTSGQLDFMFNGMDNMGLGFGITSEKSAARLPINAGSFYWGGYFGTAYWADPKAKLIGLIMTQQSPNSHGDLTSKVEQLIYQSLK